MSAVLKSKKVKIAFIEARFPELTSPKMYQSGKGEGGTMKVAIRNAVSNLLKSRVLAHKRISVFSCMVTITEKANNEVLSRALDTIENSQII